MMVVKDIKYATQKDEAYMERIKKERAFNPDHEVLPPQTCDNPGGRLMQLFS